MLNVIFMGVQKVQGYPDQWVFTDRLSGSTFYTNTGISYAELAKQLERVRCEFTSKSDRSQPGVEGDARPVNKEHEAIAT